MTCRDSKTGEIENYDRFKEESMRPRRTQKAQRKELNEHINELTAQGDWWNLVFCHDVI